MTYENNTNNGEVLQTVEPERSPLRWLWWLLGLLALAALVFGLSRACHRPEVVDVVEPAVTETAHPEPTETQEVTTLPAEIEPVEAEHVNIAEADLAHLREEVHNFDADLSEHIDDSHLAEGFRNICAAWLNGGNLLDYVGHFGVADLADEAATHLNGLVNETWCHRP